MSTKSRCVVSMFATSIVLSLFVSNSDAQKLLQWRFQPGESIQVSFTQDMTVQMNAMGKPMESSADMGMQMRWDVKNVDANGTADIHQSIERLTMQMQTPGAEPISYDSAQTEDPIGMAAMLAATVDPMVGVAFNQKMSREGEVLEVTLSDQAQQQLASAPQGAQLKEILSRDGLKALLSQAATVFPKTPVKPGDTWTGSCKSKSPIGELSMDMRYKYVGTETHQGRALERIDVEMVVSFPEAANPAGMSIAVQNQQNAGSMFFDAAAGRFVSTQLNQNMRLVTKVGEQEHAQMMTTVLKMSFAPMNQVASASKTPSAVQPAGYIAR